MGRLVAAAALLCMAGAGTSAMAASMSDGVQGEITVDDHFVWEYHNHHLQVTTHRKLMQPPGGGGPEDVAAGGDTGGVATTAAGAGPVPTAGAPAPASTVAVDAAADGGGGGPGDGGPEEETATAPASDLVLAATGAEFAPSEFYTSYEIDDEESGASMVVSVNATYRSIVSNTIPIFDVGETTFPEDDPYLISAQELSVTLPILPTYTGIAESINIMGVSVLGQKFEPGTGETVICDGGVELRVEALQNFLELGVDFNNAHVQPTGEYHFHGLAPASAYTYVEPVDETQDIVHAGFAYDGYHMYFSRSGAYKSSYQLVSERAGQNCVYNSSDIIPVTEEIVFDNVPDGTFEDDWEYVAGSGDLDECNGVIIGDTYAYFITEGYPYVSRCLMGESAVSDERGGGPGEMGGMGGTEDAAAPGAAAGPAAAAGPEDDTAGPGATGTTGTTRTTDATDDTTTADSPASAEVAGTSGAENAVKFQLLTVALPVLAVLALIAA